MNNFCYALFVSGSVIVYGAAVVAAWLGRDRWFRAPAPALRLRDRLLAEDQAVTGFCQTVRRDASWRTRYIQQCLSDNAYVQGRLLADRAQSTECLERCALQQIRHLDDRTLLRFVRALTAPRAASRASAEFHERAQAVSSRRQLVVIVAGGLLLSGMLLWPPWHSQQLHRVRIVHGSRQLTVLQQQSLGCRWIFQPGVPPDRVTARPTRDVLRFEEQLYLSTIHYRRLVGQTCGLTILIAVLVWRLGRPLTLPPAPRPSRPAVALRPAG